MNAWTEDQVSIRVVMDPHPNGDDRHNPPIMEATTTPPNPTAGGGAMIQRLSQEVVDRIAAGEVVQRPAAAVKELLENCLDAHSTNIVIHIEHGGLSKIMISDNGRGIHKDDLGLAATRFCTSKFCHEQDFGTLSTFGFRGEALASMSMVCRRLTITSRVATGATTAFTQHYVHGAPQLAQPKPCARPIGTTVTCQDLFYNLPQRTKLREAEEYKRILQVVEQYAVQYASRGVTMVCQRNKSNKSNTTKHTSNTTTMVVDLNTSNCILQPAQGKGRGSEEKGEALMTKEDRNHVTKKVLAQVFDSKLENRLLYLECSSKPKDDQKICQSIDDGDGEAVLTTTDEDHDSNNMTFQCTGFLSDPTYEPSSSSHGTTTLILFVNDRLVECQPLKRALEQSYAGLSSKGNKPFLYVSLQVPPTQVDVNVHPTKRQVTLLYLDDICHAIQTAAKTLLQSKQQDHAFTKASVETIPTINPYIKRKRTPEAAPEESEGDSCDDDDDDDDDEERPPLKKKEAKVFKKQDSSSSSKPQAAVAAAPPSRKLAPSKMIRTSKAAPSGAIEPFLVRTQMSSSQSSSQRQQPTPSPTTTTTSPDVEDTPPTSLASSSVSSSRIHEPTCPLALSSSTTNIASTIDMTQPGAFAEAFRNCTCRPPSPAPSSMVVVRQARQVVVRPSRVTPTPCNYASIGSLRKHVNKMTSPELVKNLRDAIFCGVVSPHRSLVQCGMDLVLWNHFELAQELFYQLALAKFGGGSPVATLGNSPIDIQIIIAQALELEEQLQHCSTHDDEAANADDDDASVLKSSSSALLPVSDTNEQLACQAATCLLEHAEMLLEYFSIRIQEVVEERPGDDHDARKKRRTIVISGLPVLLEGHSPSPHGLAVFLLRLATEVDWSEEQPCFQGICRELGAYYAQVPVSMTEPSVKETSNNNSNNNSMNDSLYIQHCLFPAISYLLLPPKRFAKDGSISQLTALPVLYKVFERC